MFARQGAGKVTCDPRRILEMRLRIYVPSKMTPKEPSPIFLPTL